MLAFDASPVVAHQPGRQRDTVARLEIEMKEFTDADGHRWIASAHEEESTDYKGRFYMVMKPADGGEALPLRDVRWNSERTARRTIETMSVVELRRRLRSARGRNTPLPLA